MPPLVWWGDADPGARMTDVDRLLLLALDAYEADLCHCGHPRAEAWAEEHNPTDPDHVAHYDASLPFRCHACTALATAQKRYGEKDGAQSEGAYWVAELVPNPLLALRQQAPRQPEGGDGGQ